MAGDTSEPQGDGRCWRVQRDASGVCEGGVDRLGWSPETVAPPEVVVQVEAAGFNYKDALCCRCHPGVMRVSPLVPGIDAAGTLLRPAAGLSAGDAVVVTGGGIGEQVDGSFATHLRVSPAAVLPSPPGLSAADAMVLGTAGLTALMACDRLDALVDPRHAKPDEAWLVTGASGGVGMVAVALLAASGKRVVACSRKPDATQFLKGLGAVEVLPPSNVVDPTPKSLATGRWAGVVDTVGGSLLADILRSVRIGGAVAAIGMAGGADLVTTVHPFILRGVTLAGIDIAVQPTQEEKQRLWGRLAAAWPSLVSRLPVTRLRLDDIGDYAVRMLAGETTGRGVVIL
jgi:acrylyl-CoA reductase (NADPH)